MDKATIIGIILAVFAVGTGMVLKGVELVALLNPAAILIIFGGTAAAVFVSFPMKTIKKVPALVKIIFTENKQGKTTELIEEFTRLSQKTRKEGLLSLEAEVKEMQDPFLKSGLQLVIDGQSSDFIREVLLEKIDAMEKRHQAGASIFSQAGTYAPTLGVLGAVVGLIAALKDMDDMAILGQAISAAFVATLFGIFTGYVLWHPFANKLKEKSKKEILDKEIMVEGILSITNGDSPNVLRDKLYSYISDQEIELAVEQNAKEEEE